MKLLLVATALLAACTDPAKPVDPEHMGSGSGEPAPPTPGGGASCGMDEHACGTSCVANRPNDWSSGCSMGCGGACAVPAHGSPTCTTAGLCGIACDDGYSLVGDQCVAASCEQAGYSCGTYDGGEGSVDCGSCLGTATCGVDHQCQIARDSKEANDTLGAATNLGDYNDYDDRKDTFGALSIDSAHDEDWFTFHVTDGFDAGNPDAYVQLSHSHVISGTDVGWLDSDHELTVWFKCDGADNGSSVTCGEWYSDLATDTLHDPVLGVGCTVNAQYSIWAHVSASCATTSDNGVVTVRVRKTQVPMGDTYDLGVDVE